MTIDSRDCLLYTWRRQGIFHNLHIFESHHVQGVRKARKQRGSWTPNEPPTGTFQVLSRLWSGRVEFNNPKPDSKNNRSHDKWVKIASRLGVSIYEGNLEFFWSSSHGGCFADGQSSGGSLPPPTGVSIHSYFWKTWLDLDATLDQSAGEFVTQLYV